MPEKGTVYIVHSVDTEGPLYESLQATFDRLSELFSLEMEASHQNLKKLQNCEIDLGGREEEVARLLSPELLGYNDSWDKLEKMHETLLSKEFRNELIDSFGGGWIFCWFCLDHVGFQTNPRRRDMGYHNIHDRYLEILDRMDSKELDEIQWHFHPMSTYKEAHRCATSYVNSPHLHETLCRRILERNFFPSAFRAGFQTLRPDSHWFLEQWIPFDCTNMALDDPSEFEVHNDFADGRFGDWRRAPSDWRVYQPDFHDYQKEGNCNRYIGRFLNLKARLCEINQYEVDKAFQKADRGESVLMGLNNHDFRDMISEVNRVREFIRQSAMKYPEVKFRFSNTVDAFNAVCHDGKVEGLKLDIRLERQPDRLKVYIKTVEGKVFGPQPYLAIETRSGRFIHDNLDFGLDGRSWSYCFDTETVPAHDLKRFAVAANNQFGSQHIELIEDFQS